jgi:thiol-disulfide isomerase/thioredoxin
MKQEDREKRMSEEENFNKSSPASPRAPEAQSGRRHWLLAGVGMAAGLGGALVAWQKFQPKGVMNEAVQNFWVQEFEKPEGGTLSLQSMRGKPLLVNFWATWCPPCIEELPLIDAFYVANQSKSLQVLGLAVDQPSMVRRYLGQKPLNFPIGLAGYSGTALGQSLGNQQNVLPYSLLFDANGMLLKQKAGKLEQSDLDAWLRSVI